jgi:hypothetical protein
MYIISTVYWLYSLLNFFNNKEGIDMKNIYLKKLSGALVAVLLAFVAVTSQAALVYEEGSTTNVIGITDLFVIDTFYNVSFVETTAEDLYGPEPLEFQFFGQLASQAALDATLAALNADVNALTVGDVADPTFGIAFSLTPSLLGVNLKKGNYVDTQLFTGWITGEEGESAAFTSILTYADFQPVPVPAAAWLFGSALIGLAGIARKRVHND